VETPGFRANKGGSAAYEKTTSASRVVRRGEWKSWFPGSLPQTAFRVLRRRQVARRVLRHCAHPVQAWHYGRIKLYCLGQACRLGAQGSFGLQRTLCTILVAKGKGRRKERAAVLAAQDSTTLNKINQMEQNQNRNIFWRFNAPY
jgi:hypothetical protein